MKLKELIEALNPGAQICIYTEQEVIYEGNRPFMEVPGKYADRKVIEITPRENLTLYAWIEKEN